MLVTARRAGRLPDFEFQQSVLGNGRSVMTSWMIHRHSWLSSVEQGLRWAIGATRATQAGLRVVFAKGRAMRALALSLLFGVIAAIAA